MKRITFFLVLAMLSSLTMAQIKLTGTVYDENSSPLPGASIQIKNDYAGTVTDANGKFVIESKNSGELIVVASFMGYEPKEKSINTQQGTNIDFNLIPKPFLAEEVLVQSTRGAENAIGTISKINNQQIEEQNLGQDLPYLLNLTPSLVTSSDGGSGVGYTSFRIRGTDANRVNVTVNGIPMNDAESHGVWWVNMPDFASSIDNMQVQRGVGGSTNGAGAFGASINMQTSQLKKEAFAEVSSSVGSFNTIKNNIKVGSGLLGNHFAFEARLSKIKSDGFIDRAASDLKSYFVSGNYHTEKTLVKINVFSGKEKTYQAWNGVPKVRLENDYEGMQRYEDHWLYSSEETQHMMESNNRTYNLYTYDNETDNYQQDHFQLFFSQSFSENITFNSAFHYTYGRGYYEQYRKDDDLADYRIDDIIIGGETISSSDLVRQKWLDNDFGGLVASINYNKGKIDATLGGAVNKYDGRHFGQVIWGQYLGETPKDYEWYRNIGAKTDMNIYGKVNYEISEKIDIYGDLQYRRITHNIQGYDDDYRNLDQDHFFNFVNPKLGLSFKPSTVNEIYAFYATGHREPNRSNLVDAASDSETPTFERLNDFEFGYNHAKQTWQFGLNGYYMLYKDQLVLTGEINDVGSAIMTNVDHSYRLGLEIFGGVKIFKKLSLDANATISQNKITDYTEYVDNWDTWGQDEIAIGTTDIAFSPNLIANAMLRYEPIKNMSLSFNSQYVSKQYIDNSASSNRMLDAYFISHLNAQYSLKLNAIKEIQFSFMVNNIFNELYETNAWVYSYMLGGERYEMDGYFPQAGTNFMAGITLKF